LLGPVDVVVKNDASKATSNTERITAGFLYAQRADVTLATGLTVKDWAIDPISNFAFVVGTGPETSGSSFLKVVNLSVRVEDLSQRVGLNQTIATLPLPADAGTVSSVAILPERDLIFVSTRTELIVIYAGNLNVESNPADELVILARCSLESARGGGIAASGNTVYVAAGSDGVRMINTHFPDRPFLMDTITTQRAALDVKIVAGPALLVREGILNAPVDSRSYPYAYGQVQLNSGLAEIFDIISSEHERLSSVEIDFERVKVLGNSLFFVSQLNGLAKYDISNLRAPVALGQRGGLGALNEY